MGSDGTDSIPTPGRPVVLERTPAGFWTLLLGGGLAVLAPLFGFLIGTALGSDGGRLGVSPLYLGMFGGVVLGGLGVLVALVGGVRLFRGRGTAGATGSAEPESDQTRE